MQYTMLKKLCLLFGFIAFLTLQVSDARAQNNCPGGILTMSFDVPGTTSGTSTTIDYPCNGVWALVTLGNVSDDAVVEFDFYEITSAGTSVDHWYLHCKGNGEQKPDSDVTGDNCGIILEPVSPGNRIKVVVTTISCPYASCGSGYVNLDQDQF